MRGQAVCEPFKACFEKCNARRTRYKLQLESVIPAQVLQCISRLCNSQSSKLESASFTGPALSNHSGLTQSAHLLGHLLFKVRQRLEPEDPQMQVGAKVVGEIPGSGGSKQGTRICCRCSAKKIRKFQKVLDPLIKNVRMSTNPQVAPPRRNAEQPQRCKMF